jgi:hypothetical protein
MTRAHRLASASWAATLAALVALVALTSACGAEGPALSVSLQVVESTGSLDTSNVQGFLLLVGDQRRQFLAESQAQVRVEFTDPPAGPTPVVLYACETRAGCVEDDASFVGCSTPDLKPDDVTLTVVVALHPMPASDEPPPPGCEDVGPIGP